MYRFFYVLKCSIVMLNLKLKECVTMLELLKEKEFDQFYALLEDSFPKSEIRSFQGQKELLNLSVYNVYVLKEDEVILAFFAEWQNESHRFLEHLAVNEKYRSRGLGSKTLQAYTAQSDKPVVLEVEPPNDDIQIRRVKFYEKNGFHLTSYGYVQPVINEGYEGVPLVMMTYPKKLNHTELALVKDWLDETVYK